MSTGETRLADGRRLAHLDLGDPAGTPVLYQHGGLSCSRDIAFADARCRERGVRLVAPDRPGIGGSQRRPGRTVADWAGDVAALADALEIRRFAVLGWSAGGPYAIACAHLLGDRVTAVATVGSVSVPERANVARLELATDRLLFPVSRWAPPIGRLILEAGRLTPAPLTHAALKRSVRGADIAAVEAIDAAEVRGWYAGAARHGAAGLVDDYRALSREWGFPLAEVTRPVVLLQGADDALVPPEDGRDLAARLPAADLRILPAAGHFLLRERLEETLAVLGA